MKKVERQQISKQFKFLMGAAALAIGLSTTPSALANNPSAINFWGTYSTQMASDDYSQPAPDRSYFTTSVQDIPDGAKLILEIRHGRGSYNSPVSVYLQAAINDGNGNVEAIPFLQLDDKVADNPSSYYSRREYTLTYDDLNKALEKVLPPGATSLKIGPGSPLFAFAEFPNFNHQWGSIGRGGIFFMPENGTSQQSASAAARRPVELDLAYPIPQTMTFKYNDPATKTGLKLNGQIRSRVEDEGKYQVPLQDPEKMKKRLFEIAENPAEATRLLGPDWTIVAEMRYMKKDAAGNLIKDKNGLPTPDPMVDTYYDNDNFDAAKNDMAIRYRWTEGNATGAWNFKPGMTHTSHEGVARRLEYGVDTTDDKPQTIRKFVDSLDPLNPFRMIRDVVPGANPSDFLKPSVKIEDTRYKFKLKHTNGLVIEVSLDQVHATTLRGKGATARYAQLEMDIDHMSTASQNVANGSNSGSLSGQITSWQKTFLAKLDGKAILDGRPVMHTQADLDANSPVALKHAADFQLATQVIVALRDEVSGKNWLKGPQKYALAARALDLVDDANSSHSVKLLLKHEQKLKAAGETITVMEKLTGAGCGQAFSTP